MFTSDGLHNEFKDLDLVTSAENFVIFEVNFMLTNGYFVVAGFYFKAHLCQDIYDFTTSVICKVCWSQVKIATFIVYFKSWISIFIQLEEEEFWFWSKVKGFEPKFFHMTKGTFQVATWVSCKWFPFCRIDITDQASYATIFISPRENCPCSQIWVKIHI